MIDYGFQNDFSSQRYEEADLRNFYAVNENFILADAVIVQPSILRTEQAPDGICRATTIDDDGTGTSFYEIDIPEANFVERPRIFTLRNAQNVEVFISNEERSAYIRTLLCAFLSLFTFVLGPFYLASVILAVRGSNCISSSSSIKLNVNDYLYGFGMYGLALMISMFCYIFRGICEGQSCCSFFSNLASYVVCCFCPFTVVWIVIGGLVLFQNQIDCIKSGDPTTSFALFTWIFSLLLLPICCCLLKSAVIAVAGSPEPSPDIQYPSIPPELEHDLNSIFTEPLRNRSSSAMNSITLGQSTNDSSSNANMGEGVNESGRV